MMRRHWRHKQHSCKGYYALWTAGATSSYSKQYNANCYVYSEATSVGVHQTVDIRSHRIQIIAYSTT